MIYRYDHVSREKRKETLGTGFQATFVDTSWVVSPTCSSLPAPKAEELSKGLQSQWSLEVASSK